MEENRSFTSFIGQFFATYGIIVTIFIFFCKLVGNSAKQYSSLYSFGDGGLSWNSLIQLLGLAFIITFFQAVFLTDTIIRNMKMVARIALFLLTICLIIILFSVIFNWFPINNFNSWLGFGISFLVCTAISVSISILEEKSQNRKMEKALRKFNSEEE